MNIILSKEKVDLQKCDVLVTGFFKDEKPLRGSSGWIDWRLNGRLSRSLMEEKLTGEWRETILIPSEGRILPRMILLCGLGEVKKYNTARLLKLPVYLIDILRKLDVSEVCVSLPYEEDDSVSCKTMVETVLEGFVDGFDQHETSLEESWVKNLRLYFAEGEDYYQEALLGIQAARSDLIERVRIKISLPSDVSPTRPGKSKV